MQWSDIDSAPSSRKLRQFASLCLLVFAGLALWQYFGRGHTSLAIALVSLAGTLGFVGLVRPQALKWIYVGWMMTAFPIGWVISRAILAIIFFVIITPIALAFRVCGRDVLQLRRRSEQASYWLPKPEADPRSYFRQF